MSFDKHLCPGAKPLKVTAVFLLQLLPSLSAFVLEGSKTSYAQFPAWDVSSESEARLSFEFRTAKPSGLLLYSDTVTCQYLELRMVSGELRARIDTGPGGRALLRVTSGDVSPQGWADGQWHRVTLVRSGVNTSLSVDSRHDSVMCDASHVTKHQSSSSSGKPEWPGQSKVLFNKTVGDAIYTTPSIFNLCCVDLTFPTLNY